MNLKTIKLAFAGLCLALTSSANAGFINLDGNIELPYEVDHWTIDVTAAGTFIFDVLANEENGDDFFGNGENNDHLDSHIYLFADDANGAFLADSSEDTLDESSDGSFSYLDSYMELYLDVGTYLFAIGDYGLFDGAGLSEYNARQGRNDLGVYTGNYSVTVSSDDGGSASLAGSVNVPEPSTFALLSLALVGLVARKAKK